MFHTQLEVDPAAVREVSGVGAVIAQTTRELEYENTTQVNQVMIIDVGEEIFADALSLVQDRLQERGWTEEESADVPRQLNMRSTVWDKVYLRVGPPSLLGTFPAEKHPVITKALKDNADGTHAYLMMELIKTG
jgi:hypothetical protein